MLLATWDIACGERVVRIDHLGVPGTLVGKKPGLEFRVFAQNRMPIKMIG